MNFVVFFSEEKENIRFNKRGDKKEKRNKTNNKTEVLVIILGREILLNVEALKKTQKGDKVQKSLEKNIIEAFEI